MHLRFALLILSVAVVAASGQGLTPSILVNLTIQPPTPTYGGGCGFTSYLCNSAGAVGGFGAYGPPVGKSNATGCFQQFAGPAQNKAWTVMNYLCYGQEAGATFGSYNNLQYIVNVTVVGNALVLQHQVQTQGDGKGPSSLVESVVPPEGCVNTPCLNGDCSSKDTGDNQGWTLCFHGTCSSGSSDAEQNVMV